MPTRTETALLGLLASLALTVVLWQTFHTLLVFLVVPFVPFVLGRRSGARPVRQCPTCGFETRDPSVAFCPHDGTELDTVG